MKRLICLIFIGSLFSVSAWAQRVEAQSDTILLIDSVPQHSPTKATLLSLAVPGLGQAYNKKYWKIPVVFAAIGTPLYFGLDQQSRFNEFKAAYVKRVDDDPTTVDDKYMGVYTNQNLLSLIDYHRKNRDLFFVLTGIAYALNVVDAAVDAHLYYFEVSDDLSATIKPSFQYSMPQQLMIPSLTFSLKITKKPHRTPF